MDRLVSPNSIAIVGVSADSGKIAGRLLPILQGSGFAGNIFPVNPKWNEMNGMRCYSNLVDLPSVPDVAIVLVPNLGVAEVLRQAVQKKIPYVIVFSSGFNETKGQGEVLAAELAEIVKGTKTRLVGPNSEGLFDVVAKAPMSFSPVIDPDRGRIPLRSGQVVIVSQSGGIGFAIADQLDAAGVGIRAVVTTGNELDLEVADFVDYYGQDADVNVIVLFVEGLADPEHMVDACRHARENGKTVFAIRIGSSPAGQRAVQAHTGKNALQPEVFEDIFRRAQVSLLSDIEDVIDATMAVGRLKTKKGSRVAIVSVSGGGGIWSADLMNECNLEIPPLSDELRQSLKTFLPKYASLLNPIDLTAQAIYDGTIVRAVEEIFSYDEFDGVLLVATLGYDHLLLSNPTFRKTLQTCAKPMVIFSYTPPSETTRRLLDELGVVCFSSPRRAVRALARGLCAI